MSVLRGRRWCQISSLSFCQRYPTSSQIQVQLPSCLPLCLWQNTQVQEGKEFRQGFGLRSERRSDIDRITSTVWAYRGSSPNPKWKDDEPGTILLGDSVVHSADGFTFKGCTPSFASSKWTSVISRYHPGQRRTVLQAHSTTSDMT